MLLSICKEITYLASVYPSISITFLEAPVSVGFQHLSSLPPALCILHLFWQKIPSLLWAFAFSCLGSGRDSLAFFHGDYFYFLLFVCSVLECKIQVRLVEIFSLAAGRSRRDLWCVTVSWWHRTAHFCNYTQYQQCVRILTCTASQFKHLIVIKKDVGIFIIQKY